MIDYQLTGFKTKKRWTFCFDGQAYILSLVVSGHAGKPGADMDPAGVGLARELEVAGENGFQGVQVIDLTGSVKDGSGTVRPRNVSDPPHVIDVVKGEYAYEVGGVSKGFVDNDPTFERQVARLIAVAVKLGLIPRAKIYGEGPTPDRAQKRAEAYIEAARKERAEKKAKEAAERAKGAGK